MKNKGLKFNHPTFEELSDKEWLITNGIGGYASSTLSGAHSRRYHGLLVAALQPPTGRTVLVSKVEETILLKDGNSIPLSANQFPGVVDPKGFEYLREFERSPLPRFRFHGDGFQLDKTIFMPYGSNTTVVQYENTGKKTFRLHLRPFLADRDYHGLSGEDAYYNYWLDWNSSQSAIIYPHYDSQPLYFSFTKGSFIEERSWYKQYQYQKETYRGLDDREDLFTPGYVKTELLPGERIYLVFTLDPAYTTKDPGMLKLQALERIKNITLDPEVSRLSGHFSGQNGTQFGLADFVVDLVLSGDQFIVERASSKGHTLIAGYHWFTDWGRDTMIAMRGLVIALWKKELAESIIRTFLQYLDKGMLPNRFPDQGEIVEYNTIDATLWLFIVLHEYVEKFGDLNFIEQIFPHLTEILSAHQTGTRYGIHMTEESLLFGGEGLSQLTWMDARVGDHVVTPRHGCPVEINALWYNALMIYSDFATRIGEAETQYSKLAMRVKAQFKHYFYNGVYLNDVVIPGAYVDDAIRPNQIYALSLPYPLLEATEAKQVFKTVREKLLTPLGLRSLDTAHRDFKSTYGGDQWHRDTAYHQGTVWTFLIGEYWLATLRMQKYSKKAIAEVQAMMSPFMAHFYQRDCIHGISEIFDGMTPDAGRGCVHQAWSVGMLLKVLADIAERTPVAKGSRKVRSK